MPSPERLVQYTHLMRLDRPIGTLLLLWPTLWALWIAGEGSPEPVRHRPCSSSAPSSCALPAASSTTTTIADVDPHVERTRDRPLATGSGEPERRR